ncbi:MAG: hypothetical protein MCSN_3490 [Candidatus Microsyncoccus archaeolyticus]|nr:MAG: hypothetical protein MCSN_3490 [Candidatus Parcubacteria bacterium]
MYVVVFRNIGESISKDVVTWSIFQTKQEFDSWWENAENARNWYEIVEQGVTRERAIELCTTPEAREAASSYIAKEFSRLINDRLKNI